MSFVVKMDLPVTGGGAPVPTRFAARERPRSGLMTSKRRGVKGTIGCYLVRWLVLEFAPIPYIQWTSTLQALTHTSGSSRILHEL